MQDAQNAGQRLDKWLWHARFARTRTQAAHVIEDGRVRLSRAALTEIVMRPSQMVRPGDILTLRLQAGVMTIRILDIAQRRGPPASTRSLYEDAVDTDRLITQENL